MGSNIENIMFVDYIAQFILIVIFLTVVIGIFCLIFKCLFTSIEKSFHNENFYNNNYYNYQNKNTYYYNGNFNKEYTIRQNKKKEQEEKLKKIKDKLNELHRKIIENKHNKTKF